MDGDLKYNALNKVHKWEELFCAALNTYPQLILFVKYV